MTVENMDSKSSTLIPREDQDLEKGANGPEPKESTDHDENEYPTDWRKITLIMSALYLAMFVVALDRTIIGTAIPSITDDFHSIDDVGWYASAYLLTSCAFQLIYGRIYTFYSTKNVLLSCILLFEVGSTVCGAAPNSTAFIIGRAIAGMGGAGIFSGVINVMIITIPLHKRPMYQGIFGAVFGVSSVCGPLLGGAFTTHVSWRWCFYINLPIGAVVVAIIILILTVPPVKNTDTRRQQFKQLDPAGTAVFLPGIVCLLLALQWGGNTYAWANARIIVLFVLAAILISIFVIIQIRSGENATVPIRVIKQRSILAGLYFSVVSPGAMFIMIYFLPLWFQAIKGVSAVQSGIDTLPLVLSLVVASIIGGALCQKSGYYVPQLYVCTVCMTIGAGLITTFKVNTGHAEWIGYQVLFGFGLGFGMQQASMSAQACLPKKDVMVGIALMFFMQGLGGSIFISIGQVIFTNSLVRNLKGVPGLDLTSVVNMGATELKEKVPKELLGSVLVAYNKALMDTMYVAVGCAAATIFAAIFMEWKNIKGQKQAGELAVKESAKEEKIMSAEFVKEGSVKSIKK